MNPVAIAHAKRREKETDVEIFQRVEIERALANVIRDAERTGYCVEVRTESLTPPAMRNHRPVIYIWKAR